MRAMRIPVFILVALLLALLAACGPAPAPTSEPTRPPEATPLPSPTPTPEPKMLSVCIGQEPQTLYPYGGSSQAMWSVLEAVYDGPIDSRGYDRQPVILAALPTVGDDVTIEPVAVSAGETVVDAGGSLVALAAGVQVHPSGCNAPDCVQTYDGSSELQMDQASITYRLLPDLKWSDGAPLTAADSVYSYRLASDPETPASKYFSDRTADYQAADEVSLHWTGRPGFVPANYADLFWMPLPEHAWGQIAAADLVTAPEAAQKPLGWGPYVIEEWVKGDHITLARNPQYFRAAEGLPKFDRLVFRFISQNPSGNVAGLLSGECDVVDATALLETQLQALLELRDAGKLKLEVAQGPEWEHLDFGIKPASYDNGYAPALGDRPNFFGDVRTRQAFAQCLDREAVVKRLLFGQSAVVNSYLPPQHPLYNPDVTAYAYNPGEGARLLDEVGWKDMDNDPATPRVALGVAGVPDGTPLQVTYATTQAALRQQSSEILIDALRQCGIGVEAAYLTPDQLFAQGPDGPLFGRKFDLAQFTWESSTTPLCYLYETARIPSAGNHWVGVNVSGYSNPQYDAVCQAAQQARPDQPAYREDNLAAQAIFGNELPVVPLFQHLKLAITRPDVCGLEMDPSARSVLWNIENFDLGADCK